MTLVREVERAVRICRPFFEERNLKLVAHYDADGLCSAAILLKALVREGYGLSLRIIEPLPAELKGLELDDGDFLVLLDLGSGQLPFLRDLLDRVPMLILDHHEFQGLAHPNLFHLNPLAFNAETSASHLTYIFAKFMSLRNVDLVDLALVGAVGDECDLTKGMAANLLKEAKDLGMVRVLRGLRLYGRNTRPIHKALEHSFDPFIPGVSGSESQAVQFLADLEIGLKEDDRWRRLADLSLDEQRRLATAIIRERLKLEEERAWDIFGDVYTFTHRPPELSDAREFATLLNACGRTGNFRLAIELALGSEGAIPMAQGLLEDYRRMICSCLDLLSEACRITDHATYVLGMEKVPPTLIGVLISIALRSNLVPQEKPVFGFAASKDGLKVSARCLKPGMDLGKCLREVIGRIGGFAGGHRMAAGGFIGVDGLEDFIKLMDEELSKHA